jgi:hypothetical protein
MRGLVFCLFVLVDIALYSSVPAEYATKQSVLRILPGGGIYVWAKYNNEQGCR